MTKTATTKRTFTTKPSRSSAKKSRWNSCGLRREDQRDAAALSFARLGLLASRW